MQKKESFPSFSARKKNEKVTSEEKFPILFLVSEFLKKFPDRWMENFVQVSLSPSLPPLSRLSLSTLHEILYVKPPFDGPEGREWRPPRRMEIKLIN